MMMIRLSSCPIVDRSEGFTSIAITSDALPPETVAVSSLPEAIRERDRYREAVAATGKPAAVFMGQAARCKARKFPGFTKESARTIYVN